MHLPPSYLTQNQQMVVNIPVKTKVFLYGPAGTGKTTVGIERLHHLLENGVPGSQILLFVPQRTLATPYFDAINNAGIPAGSRISVMTIGGLARRMIDLFWPLIAGDSGFSYPDLPPTFLTMETAQYYMAHVVRPHLSEGLFESVRLDRNRLYSQILDNLNKAAVHTFSHFEIGNRLKSAWIGDPGQVHVYEDVQLCANDFRQYCLENNLLDFSLQLEIFKNRLWHLPICRQYILNTYKHLIFDNLEEDTPVTADILQDWIPQFDSSLLIFDNDAGYRRFLGADPESTESLSRLCDVHIEFNQGFVSSENITFFGTVLSRVLVKSGSGIKAIKEQITRDSDIPNLSGNLPITIPRPAIRFFPDMLDWIVNQISALIDEGTPLDEIVILAPYLSDALRYSLADRLDRAGIPSHSHRPSRSLRDEPASRCMLTLAKLAHPHWDFHPPQADVSHAFLQAIGDMDLIRSQLLTQIIYQKGKLLPFENIKPRVQERITYLLGGRYDHLRLWIEDYISGESIELDHFLSRIFGELLSQPGYNFHANYDAGVIVANLVESIKKFRWATGETLKREGLQLGKVYLEMVEDGVIASQYLTPWRFKPEDSILLAPAYTFLMSNRPVDFQFWINVGSRGWYERLYQPLTHPYVLSRRWIVGKPWTDLDESATAQETLHRLSLGLIRRCRKGIYLGFSELGEQGYEHKGDLLKAVDKALFIISTLEDHRP
jgi:hypothetical protein